MKKPGSIFLALFLFLSCVFSVHAQSPVLFTSDTAVTHGASFSIPVKVYQFNNITGLQFVLSWNSNQLQFQGIEQPALDIRPEKNFGASEANAGILRFLWFEESLAPVTLPDSAVLFKINFECIGKTGGESPILFTEDDLTKIEVYNEKHARITAQFDNALLSITNETAGGQINQNEPIELLYAYPNPFSNSTNVAFRLYQDGPASLTLYDLSGKKIYEETFELNKGSHRLLLPARRFPSPGAYVCRIQAAGSGVSQEIIFK